MTKTKELIIFLLCFILGHPLLFGQWPALPAPNVPVTNQAATTDAARYWAAPDGVGGSYAVWEDDRNDPGGKTGVFCQRMQSFGVVKFVANGITISDIAGSNQRRPWVAEGANSSALIVWEDERNSGTTSDDIYAKSIDSIGTALWGGANGLVICNAANKQERPQIVSDGSGGAIIAWRDRRTGGRDIYAQRVNSAGVVQWTINGEVICNAAGKQSNFSMIEDGSGGAIIVWEDDRNATTDIYAQLIDNSGVVQWGANGVAVCTNTANDQTSPVLVTDNAGGAIISWEDQRTGLLDIYAQRISSAGVAQWTSDGIVICNATDDQQSPTISEDGSGGAVISWEDKRNTATTSDDVYTQRVNGSGVAQWAVNGIVVCNSTQRQRRVHSSISNNGFTLIVWEDNRNTASAGTDIYMDLVAPDGSLVGGTANGIQICDNIEDQRRPFIFANGSSQWIILWEDRRNDPGGNSDVYSQGLNPSIVSVLPTEVVSFDAVAGDNRVLVYWTTASEINNDYFIVQKSSNLKDWENIVRVNGSGNSSALIDYFEQDKNPVKGVSYYRLKQVDFNGNVSFSTAIPVKFNGPQEEMKIYPNPSDGTYSSISLPEVMKDKEILIIVKDALGTSVYSKMIISDQKGQDRLISFETPLPTGTYIIIATSDDTMLSKKLIVR